MTESTCAAEHADPFRLLLVRRAAAGSDQDGALRSAALDEAAETLLRAAKGFVTYFPHEVREVAVAEAMIRLNGLCCAIYEGTAVPPHTSWKGLTATIVRNCGRDVWKREARRGGRGVRRLPSVMSLDASCGESDQTWGDLLPADDTDPESTALDRAEEDARLRSVRRLGSVVESGSVVCVFHPGKRCVHIRTGSFPRPCTHLRVVLDLLADTFTSLDPTPMNPRLRALTGYDGHEQGHYLDRHVYRCRDWFGWLLLRDDPEPSPLTSALRDRFEKRLVDRLSTRGREAPSATTVCMLMNGYPDLEIPTELRDRYGLDHPGHSEGEER